MGGSGLEHVSNARLQASIPSLCGMLVYKELTSKVSRMQSGGRGSKFEILRRKSLVSLKYDGNCMTRVVDGNLQTQRCARWELRMSKELVFQGY